MPFIGKNPTAGFATIVKDTLTADGSTTQFILSKQVASETDIAVFVGNVRQEPTAAYTVNGTTLDFGTGNAPATGLDVYVLHIGGTQETSIIPADGTISSAKLATNIAISGNLDVGTIRSASGNSALTIDSSGRVTLPNTVQIDNWRLASTFSTNAATVTGWEQPDGTTSVTVGASMTESSGIFTFPNTGVWKITGCIVFQLDTDAQAGVWFEVSTDSGSSYERMAGSFESATAYSSGNQGFTNQILVNVTNAGTTRFRLYTHSLGNNSEITASTDLNYTNLMFERITDSQ